MELEEIIKQAYRNQGGNFDGILNESLQKAIMGLGKEMFEKGQNSAFELLKSKDFTADFQIFTHDLLLENDALYTFQGIRKMVYTYSLKEGRKPSWGDKSYIDEDFESLKIDKLKNWNAR